MLDVIRTWGSIVGPDLAEHLTGSIDGDLLTVTADDPTWAAEFQWLEEVVAASPKRPEAIESTAFTCAFAGL